jgi:uncharacterized membrane protein YphA (DoxX/SURF4 family)
LPSEEPYFVPQVPAPAVPESFAAAAFEPDPVTAPEPVAEAEPVAEFVPAGDAEPTVEFVPESDPVAEPEPIGEPEPTVEPPVFEFAAEPVAEPVADAVPVAEPAHEGGYFGAPESFGVSEPVAERESFGVSEPVAERESFGAPEPIAEPEPEPVLAGPILPSVPAWVPPPAPVEPEPVAEVAPPVEAPAEAFAGEGGVDAAEPTVVAPGLPLAPPAPPALPAQAFPPAPEPVMTPPAPDSTAAFQAPAVVAQAATSVWGDPAPSGDSFAEGSDIFRPRPSPERSADAQAVSEEERRLAAERAARRDARAAAFTAPTVAAPATPALQPVVAPVAAAPARQKRTTDGAGASLGLFLVRVSLAAIFGIHGVQMLLDSATAQKLFAGTVLPMPATFALVTSIASVLIAVSMLMGLATRFSAAGAALIAAGSLALVYWGSWGVFAPGQFGFLGEGQLLIATVGLLLVFIGGGGWSLDHSLRAARQRDKATRAI